MKHIDKPKVPYVAVFNGEPCLVVGVFTKRVFGEIQVYIKCVPWTTMDIGGRSFTYLETNSSVFCLQCDRFDELIYLED